MIFICFFLKKKPHIASRYFENYRTYELIPQIKNGFNLKNFGICAA